MAKQEHDQLNLTVVALVALVAIVGLVALVLNAASLKSAAFATGVSQASAEEANAVGDVRHTDPFVDYLGTSVSGSKACEECKSKCDGLAGVYLARCQQKCVNKCI